MSIATTTTPAAPPAATRATAGVEDEVLARLLDRAGTRAIRDLESRQAEVEGRIATFAAMYGDPKNVSWTLGATLPVVRKQVELARAYRGRLATLLRLAGLEAGGPPAGPPGETADEELHRVMLAAAGPKFAADLRSHLGPAAAELRAELGQVEAQLGDLDARVAAGNAIVSAGNPEAPHMQAHPHDGSYHEYSELIGRRSDLARRIAQLEGDAARGLQAQAALVARAVEAAGGRDALAAAVRSSWQMRGAYLDAHPSAPAIAGHRAALARVDADLEKLGGPSAAGPVAESLRDDREAVASALAATTQAADGELRARIAGVVSAAIGGDEPARSELERAARAEPRAFVPGFADLIANARFEASPIGALVHEMIETYGRPIRA